MLVDILKNQILDTILKECHRSLHLLMLVEEKSTRHPLILAYSTRTDNYILRNIVLLLCLLKGKVTLRQKILIHNHTVVKILICRNACQRNTLPIVASSKALGNAYTVV